MAITEYYNNLRQLIHLNLQVPVYSDSTFENQNVELPCIVFSREGILGSQTMDGPSVNTETVTFSCKAKTIEKVEEMRDFIISILNGYSNEIQIVLNSEVDEFDINTGIYSRDVSFDVVYGADIEYLNVIIGSGAANQVTIWKDKYILTGSNAMVISGSNINFSGDVNISGSLTIGGGVVIENAVSASYSDYAVTASYVIGSSATASYAEYAVTASYALNSVAGSSGTSGVSGTSGTSGETGSSGTSGINGSSGTSGTNGSSGTSGTNGSSGTSGENGTNGSSGTSGQNGSSGTSGVSGSSGTSGESGTNGSSGTSGQTGSSGTSGTSGANGSIYVGHSTTNMAIVPSGSVVNMTVETGLAYTPTQDVTILYDYSNNMHGVIYSYNSGNGALVVNINQSTGTGTYNVWTVNLDGAVGIEGSSGTSGMNGSSGTSGANGSSGTSGVSGSSGTSGATGTNGSSGTSGANGANGTNGSSGTSGVSGSSGTSGVSGSSGTSGVSGTNGSSGTSGVSGSSGTSGANGSSGTSGLNGSSGTSGTSGVSPILPANVVTSSAQLSNGGGVAFSNSNNVTFGQITGSVALITTITASYMYASGSNIFGDSPNDIHTFVGRVDVTGSVNITGSATVAGDVLPTVDGIHSLGSPTKRWKDVYVGSSSLYVGGIKITDLGNGTLNIQIGNETPIALPTSSNFAETASYVALAQTASYAINSNVVGSPQTFAFFATDNILTDSTLIQVDDGALQTTGSAYAELNLAAQDPIASNSTSKLYLTVDADFPETSSLNVLKYSDYYSGSDAHMGLPAINNTFIYDETAANLVIGLKGTGSILLGVNNSASITINQNGIIGTSSYATVANTASYANFANTASYLFAIDGGSPNSIY